MQNNLPIVNAAFVCEKILREPDNVFSAIRVVDVFHLPPETASLPDDSGVPISAMIVVRGGDYRGNGEVSFSIVTPDGKQHDVPQKWPILFSDPISGTNLIFNFALKFKHVGTTWVEVLWNGELLTKFPITLALQTAAPQPTA